MKEPLPRIGHLVRLDLTLRASGLWPGPIWALACGIIASGGFKWSGAVLLQIMLMFFLVLGAWATLWTAVAETDWAAHARYWGHGRIDPSGVVPYAEPGAPSDRLQTWLTHTRQWWDNHLSQDARYTASSILVSILLGLTLAAVLGWPAVALSAAALAATQIGLVAGRGTGCPPAAAKATVEIALTWMLGHAILAPLTVPSVALALAFAACYSAGQTLLQGSRRATIWNGAQLAVVGLLTLQRLPVAALAVFLMIVPQLVLDPALRRGEQGLWFIRSTQAWLMAAMLLAAAAI